ncbi:hypothetical protein C900_05384 [Fulvivirga imtechensis AK7]|uniref:Uncharacterized protein n=1 Tax=Fulvivirga imtechensis AK7 TaxID=1237149 RepID=L8JLS4_9BACT|nr:hypothetical protein [Fulvivirga imtechensis]ELR69188.1 hypothetical protein C900_05384 [Fulvivirga imtechensis AK7]
MRKLSNQNAYKIKDIAKQLPEMEWIQQSSHKCKTPWSRKLSGGL